MEKKYWMISWTNFNWDGCVYLPVLDLQILPLLLVETWACKISQYLKLMKGDLWNTKLNQSIFWLAADRFTNSPSIRFHNISL